MHVPPLGRPRGGRPSILLAVALLATVATLRAGPEDSVATPMHPGPPAWLVGTPVPIASVEGRAAFQVPTPRRGGSTLVIISALSRQSGPFSLTLRAKAVPEAEARPPLLAAERPRRPARLDASAPGPVRDPVAGLPPRERTFHLMDCDGDVASARNYRPIAGRLRAVGQRVQVYVDPDDVGRVGTEVLRDLVATFDDQVFPVAARTIGQARDVDGDGRYTVLMSSRLGRLAGGRHAVDGFVRGADLDPNLAAPFSNRCDMMYLNAALAAGPHLRTIMAHEYTHSVTYSAKSFPAAGGARAIGEEEGWLDEALAHLGEDLHGFSRSNLDYRVSAFLSRPERYRLVVEDYYAADLFRSHGNRGGTYLFLRWCADRFGPGLLPALIRSPRLGVENLEAATGAAFEDLYRQWSVALFLSGFEPDRGRGDGFRSLDMRGPFAEWDLAGPRTVRVTPTADGATETWSAMGTSSHYVLVDGSPAGAVAIEVTGPREAGLQVTAVPLPDDLARLQLAVGTSLGADGALRLHARIAEGRGTPVRLSALAWEPLVPAPDPHSSAFRRGGLDGVGIASVFGASAVPPGGALPSKSIRLAGVPLGGDGLIVVKVVGTDDRGRRVAAWAEFQAGAVGDNEP